MLSSKKKGSLQPTIHVSSVVTIAENATIRQCVRLMRQKNTGSVLITDAKDDQKLVGIFTERDLLRHVEIGEKWNGWDRPVRRVMTREVRTIRLPQLPKAAEIMIAGGFRHLPVVDSVANGKLIGVVSMRDLLAFQIEREKERVKQKRRSSKVGVLSKDPSMLKVMTRGLAFIPKVKVCRMNDGEVLADASGLAGVYELKTLVVDVERYEVNELLAFLKQANRDSQIPHVVLIFDPQTQNRTFKSFLNQLSRSRKFSVFSKPVNLMHLFQRIYAILEEP